MTDDEPPAGHDDHPPADAGRPPTNPFLVPGTEMSPKQPLVPWRDPGHEDYYVGVDHTQEAYEQFLRDVANDVRTLRDNGRLVAVRGGRGCGKTSVLNRCVAWMKNELEQHGVEPIVMDLGGVGQSDKQVELRERMGQICRLVANRAVLRLGLDKSKEDRLTSLTTAPLEFYDHLSSILDLITEERNAVLIIVLPPTDLSSEIAAYAQMARSRVVFCIESTGDSPVRWPDGSDKVAAPPILLEVGPLGPTDASLFALERLAMHHSDTTMPNVGEDVMSELERSSAAATIGGLAELMRGLYAYKLSQPPPYEEITSDDVMKYYFRQVMNRDAP